MRSRAFVRLLAATLLVLATSAFAQGRGDTILQLKAHHYDPMFSRIVAADQSVVHGGMSEYGALALLRPLYQADPALGAALDDWVAARPDSYVPWLARAHWLRKQAEARRGSDFASEVSRQEMAAVQELLARARRDLDRALAINADSYFALLGLEAIAKHTDDDALARRALKEANRVAPRALLVRATYMVHLAPTWGGSVARMRAFAAESTAVGAPRDVVDLLEAQIWDAEGFERERHGDERGAQPFYAKALALSKNGDPDFANAFLVHAVASCAVCH